MSLDDLLEWLKAIVRWVHVFAAILWIGQTYLFNWFERNLEADASTPPNVMGSLWMVHGGGFYFVEKQKNPELQPRTLHWFKWEAATTWLSRRHAPHAHVLPRSAAACSWSRSRT